MTDTKQSSSFFIRSIFARMSRAKIITDLAAFSNSEISPDLAKTYPFVPLTKLQSSL